MPRQPKPKPDNPEQFKRFIETAREAEVDESHGAIDRAFARVDPSAKKKAMPARRRSNAAAADSGDG